MPFYPTVLVAGRVRHTGFFPARRIGGAQEWVFTTLDNSDPSYIS